MRADEAARRRQRCSGRRWVRSPSSPATCTDALAGRLFGLLGPVRRRRSGCCTTASRPSPTARPGSVCGLTTHRRSVPRRSLPIDPSAPSGARRPARPVRARCAQRVLGRPAGRATPGPGAADDAARCTAGRCGGFRRMSSHDVGDAGHRAPASCSCTACARTTCPGAFAAERTWGDAPSPTARCCATTRLDAALRLLQLRAAHLGERPRARRAARGADAPVAGAGHGDHAGGPFAWAGWWSAAPPTRPPTPGSAGSRAAAHRGPRRAPPGRAARAVRQPRHPRLARLPETRPFAVWLNRRSVGIKDLRHGALSRRLVGIRSGGLHRQLRRYGLPARGGVLRGERRP